MRDERDRLADRIAAQACMTPAESRAAFLESACGGDAALATKVRTTIEQMELAATKDRAPVTGRGEQHETQALPAGAVGEEAGTRLGTDSQPSAVAFGAPAEGPGDWLGPYHLVRPLGEGGFGVVFLAQQEHPVRREVAVKVLRAGLEGGTAGERIQSERQALAAMNHPGIARMFDGGTTRAGRPFIVMEYVDGQPITRYSDRERLGTRDRLALFVAVCRAVQHAHDRGVIHRDIKPNNILVTTVDGRPWPKVIDFGVAKILSPLLTPAVVTQTLQLMGTPEYMSPEQADLRAADVDVRADVYSLGIVLYELLTGVTPIDTRSMTHASLSELQRLVREVDPPAPSERVLGMSRGAGPTHDGAMAGTIAQARRTTARALAGGLKGELDWIVMRAIEKAPPRRYASVSALADDVERYLSGRPVEAARPSTVYRARKWALRHRAATAAMATAVVSGVVLIAGGAVSYQNIRAERDRATQAATKEAAALEEARIALARVQQTDEFFLTRVFGMLMPDVSGTREVTVRQAMDGAAAWAKSVQDPLLRAALHDRIGLIHMTLGNAEKAAEQQGQAIELWEAARGADHPDTLSARYRHAQAVSYMGEWERALGLLDALAAKAREILGENHTLVAAMQYSRSDVLTRLGREAEAAAALHVAHRLYRQAGDASHAAERILTLYAISAREMQSGRAQESLSLALEGIEVHTKARERPLLRAALLSQAANGFATLGRHDEALTAIEESIDLRRRLMGPDDQLLAQSLAVAANVHAAAGRFVESQQASIESLRIYRSAASPSAEAIGWVLLSMGRTQARAGRLDRARATLAEGAAVFTGALGPSDWRSANADVLLGACLVDMERYAEAEPLLKSAYQRLAAKNEVPTATITAAGRLKVLYERTGNSEGAAEWSRVEAALMASLRGP
ncbi:MAG: serine/threonine protein kinase [Phycisphaeraceae bacterium]|nr:serine/threonine protein kinase [Phycisphaeraceae bacterium]